MFFLSVSLSLAVCFCCTVSLVSVPGVKCWKNELITFSLGYGVPISSRNRFVTFRTFDSLKGDSGIVSPFSGKKVFHYFQCLQVVCCIY
jgi:hypothetical protein